MNSKRFESEGKAVRKEKKKKGRESVTERGGADEEERK